RTVVVPYAYNPNFVGRREILDRLRSALGHHQPPEGRVWQRKACLYGLSGIGKTQIALEYVYWLRDDLDPEVSVFWVDASSPEQFWRSNLSIAQECQIPGYDDAGTSVVALVKTWLESEESGDQRCQQVKS
ncbi:hypothetical protein C8A03DRAFT_20072, partial [Achaetomium macrosporum]